MHQAFAYTQTTGTYTSGFDVSTEARLDKLLWIYVSQHITTLTRNMEIFKSETLEN